MIDRRRLPVRPEVRAVAKPECGPYFGGKPRAFSRLPDGLVKKPTSASGLIDRSETFPYDILASTRSQSMVMPGTAVSCVCPLSSRTVGRP
jgi:hypothetical protein